MSSNFKQEITKVCFLRMPTIKFITVKMLLQKHMESIEKNWS